jgi:ABC-type multidrug transport system ATPase subunit
MPSNSYTAKDKDIIAALIFDGFSLSWKNLTVKRHPSKAALLKSRLCKKPVEEPKVILDGISGVINKGTFTVILGSTGAGKTTFLNTLAQRRIWTRGLDIEGELLINGKPAA